MAAKAQLTIYDALDQSAAADDQAALDDTTPLRVDMAAVERGRASRQQDRPTGRSWIPCQCGRMKVYGRKCGWCNKRTKESK